jgi:hypothetical protein
MKKIIISGAAGIILALSVSLFSHEEGLLNLRFHLGIYDSAKIKKELRDTLNLFNRNFATFFNTGGNLAGLNEFPAANMIKRRIFQEINEWKKKNQLLVYDKDTFEIVNIHLVNPVTAVTVAKEVWFLNVQERDTRKKLSSVKANPIQVRYILKRLKGNWGVIEFEVFGSKDEIPELKIERLYL